MPDETFVDANSSERILRIDEASSKKESSRKKRKSGSRSSRKNSRRAAVLASINASIALPNSVQTGIDANTRMFCYILYDFMYD